MEKSTDETPRGIILLLRQVLAKTISLMVLAIFKAWKITFRKLAVKE